MILPKNSLIFDIGACLGEKALDYLMLKPRRLVCVEPQLRCVELLHALLKPYPAVVIEPLGVSSKEGHIDFYPSTSNVHTSTCSKQFMTNRRLLGKTWGEPIPVPTTTLDALIAKYGLPDYCKIDVEGHEFDVFNGLSQPLPLLSFEFHAQYIHEARKCHERLADLGNYTFNFAQFHARSLYLPTFTTWEALLKELATHGPDFACDIFAQLTT